jgi:hypothetical protein
VAIEKSGKTVSVLYFNFTQAFGIKDGDYKINNLSLK